MNEQEELEQEELEFEFNKRFANGEQNIEISYGKIVDVEKRYFWEERAVYNHILPLIYYVQSKCNTFSIDLKESDIYGKLGLVSQLIPIQRAYNNIKNKKTEYLENLSCPPLMVEDGSVDIDNLEEEGLTHGKILVYRHGSTVPSRIEPINSYTELDKEESRLIKDFNFITEQFILHLANEANVTFSECPKLDENNI